MLQFYNTLTRKKEAFKPIHNNEVRMYSCGPTVYNYPHIGNWRAFIFADLLRRYLKFKGFKIKSVLNLTDVDDKTIKGSIKKNTSLKKFTDIYIKAFKEDMEKLSIEETTYTPRATDHIKEIVALILKLKKNNLTYESKGSTYFKISGFQDYGKLARLDFQNLIDNAQGRLDSDNYEKENARDFVLWKAYTKEDKDCYWETELGKGRPGWHIECSAMAMKYLGEEIDIHTGGMDLVFPHHTNEIAQSEGATKKRFVKFWMHNEFLLIDKDKMSKSLGNFFTLRDLMDKGYDPLAIRYVLIASHYRQQLNFSEDIVKSAKNSIDRINNFIQELKEITETKDSKKVDKLIAQTKTNFEKALDDDLSMSEALASLYDFIKAIYKLKISKSEAKKVISLLKELNSILGVMKFVDSKVPKEILELMKKRDQARLNKDWALSDQIRDQIKEKGFEVLDSKDGSKVRKLN